MPCSASQFYRLRKIWGNSVMLRDFTKFSNFPMESRLAVIINDIHAGSSLGLVPRGFRTLEGIGIGMNRVQEWLMECWEDGWEWFYALAKKDPWALIANGDMIDGIHHKTTQIFSNNLSDHISAAYNLLKKPALKANAVFLTEGTEIHTTTTEHSLAYQLEAKGVNVIRPAKESGAWDSLLVEFAGTLCKFDHHISSTSRPYLEGSALSIHMGAERQEAARSGYRIPKVFGRAHRHRFGYFSDGNGLIFCAPPWQVSTRYGRKFSPHGIPQVGMAVLDWRHTKDNEIPTLHSRLYTIKQPPIIT